MPRMARVTEALRSGTKPTSCIDRQATAKATPSSPARTT
jgi:hypothetical protein